MKLETPALAGAKPTGEPVGHLWKTVQTGTTNDTPKQMAFRRPARARRGQASFRFVAAALPRSIAIS